MVKIFNKHKKLCIITAGILAGVLFCLYLWAMFLPGLWHGDAFLYRQDDGSFKGSDHYAKYSMSISPADYGTSIDFSVNNKSNHYQIKYDENDWERNVEIFENGTLICKGKAFGAGNDYIVFADEPFSSDIVSVRVSNAPPTEEELFPGPTALYNWSVSDKTSSRGEPSMLILIGLFGLMLFLDIKFPMLFWILEHRLDVDGGKPSEWYLFGQKMGRILLAIAIPVCMIVTFTLR